ncbi:MAG: diguanylate cyclase [Magnetococcales bacterium]|nr:diguanylate cyclase [Magnetococcales bacterium]
MTPANPNIQINMSVLPQEPITQISSEQLDRIVRTLATSMVERDSLQEILDAMVNAVLVISRDAKILRVNQAAGDLLGYARQRLPGMAVERILVEGKLLSESCMTEVAHQGAIRNLETWLLGVSGEKIPVLISISALRAPNGSLDGYVCAALDISEHIRLREALRSSMENFQAIVEKSVDGILILSEENRVAYLNRSAIILLGRSEDEMLGLPFGFPMVSGDVTEVDIIRKGGDVGVAEMRAVETQWRGGNALLVALRDVTENVRLRDQLRQLSMEDELTGLNNRRGFFLLAGQELRILERSNAKLVLFFIDLDGMKPINDLLGHKFGDQALVETSAILRRAFRKSDILARLGGDEFLALTFQLGDDSPVSNILTRLNRETAHNNARPGRLFQLSLSIGFVEVSRQQTYNLEELILEADAAMYRNKMEKRQAVKGTTAP